eukprot:4662128-Pyramimonas_sp.AAC.1
MSGIHVAGIHVAGIHVAGIHVAGVHVAGIHVAGIHVAVGAISDDGGDARRLSGAEWHPRPHRHPPARPRPPHTLHPRARAPQHRLQRAEVR